MSVLSPQQIIDSALQASTSDGCIVVVEVTGQANIRWANNTVTTNGVTDALSWFVISVVRGAAGTVEASIASAAGVAEVAEVVRKSEAGAAAASGAGPARDFAALVGPGELGESGYDEAPSGTSFEVFSGLLTGLAESFDSARSAAEVLYGFARHDVATTYLGTSTGIRHRWVQPTGTLQVNAKSEDLSRSAWSGVSTVDFADVDVRSLASDLHTRLGWAGRALDLPAGRYDTVLPPTAVADFMVYLAWSSGSRPAHEGHSPFSAPGGGTRIGERLSTLPLTLHSDPTEPGLEASPVLVTSSSSDEFSVFDNGAPIQRTDLLSNGVINSLLQTRASAAEYGEPFTTFTDNLVLSGVTDASTEDLVSGLDRGLLVTSQWYIRTVDPMTLLVTGLTRDGVFLVEKGEVVGAVNNFRFNMSPLDVLRQAKEVGATVRGLSRELGDYFPRTAMPPMVVEGFNMSSVSKAQ